MKCEKVSENLSAYLSGELDEPESHWLRQHLDGCQVCTAKVSELRLFDRMFDVWEEVEPSARFRAAFFAKIRSEERRRQQAPASLRARWRQAFAWQGVALLASLCLVVFTSLYYFTLFPTGSGTPPATEAEVQIAANLPVLKDYEIINNLDLLENFDEIQNVGLSADAPAQQHN
jgi:predicted anti-sigma-YlaC factor YlaD